jgi:hypothetical protein
MIAGAAWYAYPILKRQDSSLAQLVHTQQAVDKIDGGLQEQRSKVAEWSKEQEQLRDQVTRLGREMRSRIELVRKEKGQAGENLFHAVQAQIERQIETMKGRVAALESSRGADKAQIAEITKTDAAFRRVSSWMWVLPDRRTIWLRQQGAQEPVDFYGYNDGMKRELVITSAAKGSVAGYLLVATVAESASSLVQRGIAIGTVSE